jgi:putative ABC transport system permease protein
MQVGARWHADAALFTHSFISLQRVPTGFRSESVVTARLSLTRTRFGDGLAIDEFLSRVTRDLEGIVGIESAGISSAVPMGREGFTITRAVDAAGRLLTCEWRLVDSGYFRTLGIQLIRGRLFEGHDRLGPRVFVISEQAARDLYGASDPIGQRLQLENGGSGVVVGIVADVRMRRLADPPERVVYFLPSQFGFFPLFNVVVRSDRPQEAIAGVIRETVNVHGAGLAAYDIQNMQYWLDRSASLMRIRANLVLLLGITAILLGVIGIYGAISYLVAGRTREWGIRIALGANPQDLPRTMVVKGVRDAAAGIGIGLAVAVLFATRIRGLLFGVEAGDPATLVGVATLVVVVAAIASYVPARRAARADPRVVLSAE